MKKIKGLIIIMMFAGMLLLGCQWSNTYERKAEVIKIKNEIITVKSKDGNIWEFEGDGFRVGQTVTLTMDNQGTDKIEDDRIIDVK